MSTPEETGIETLAEDTTSTVGAAMPPIVAAVSLKLPPFWPTDPTVWFAQVEAQFSTRGIISQKTRFEYIISSLSPEFAVEVRDLLLQPPAENPYNKLKQELVKRTAASEQRKLQQLISGEELGDRKPTQLLRRMQQLLGDHIPEINNTFLRELFLQRLPPNVRMVLASTGDSMDLNQLADIADKVMEVAVPTVATISEDRRDRNSEVQQLKAEVSRLADLVASLTREHRPRRSRSRSLSRSRQPRNSTPKEEDSAPTDKMLCWYHHKFGEAAKHCRQPCSWENS